MSGDRELTYYTQENIPRKSFVDCSLGLPYLSFIIVNTLLPWSVDGYSAV